MHITTGADVVSPDSLLDRLHQRDPGLVQTTTWGERALFYNPGGALPHGVYFVTLKERDSAHDDASALDVRGAYRMSFGVDPSRYQTLFGPPPARGCTYTPAEPDDPLTVDRLMPHPIYAWMSWAAVVNPSPTTLDALWPLLDESYALALRRHAGRVGGDTRTASANPG
jgi:hypothetical protein